MKAIYHIDAIKAQDKGTHPPWHLAPTARNRNEGNQYNPKYEKYEQRCLKKYKYLYHMFFKRCMYCIYVLYNTFICTCIEYILSI